MGKCLHSKFKGIFANDNIPVFGAMKLNVYASTANAEIGIVGVSFEDISVVGDTTQISPTKTPFNGWVRIATPGNHVLKVQNKYNCTLLYSVGLANEDDVKFLTNVTYLALGIASASQGILLDGGLSSLRSLDKLISLNNLSVTSNELRGSIADLLPVHQNVITTLSFNRTPNFTMNMADLGKFPNITTINSLAFSPANGAVEDFVAAQRGVGSTEKSMSIQYLGGNGRITWKGETLGNVQSNTLSWTATTITLNGETIQNSDVIN